MQLASKVSQVGSCCMVGGKLGGLLSIFACLVTLYCVALQLGAAKGGTQELRVRQVFEYKPQGWKPNDRAYGVFDSDDPETIYFIHKASVRAIRWKTDERLNETSYETLPCSSSLIAFISGWQPVPKSNFALMGYCNSLYVLDRHNMKVIRQLVSGEQEQLVTVAVSLDGRHAAVESTLSAEQKYSLRLYSVRDWKLLCELPTDSHGFAFSLDGRYLALERSVVGENKHVVRCGLEMLETPSGQSVKEWWVDPETDGCPRSFVFVRSEDHVIASSGVGGVIFRDANTGTEILRIRDPELRIHRFLIPPNGNFLVGGVLEDPQDSPYDQEFKIWDIDSGKVRYESPKKRWPLFFNPKTWSGLQMSMSTDGQYLLVTRHPRLRLYEISVIWR